LDALFFLNMWLLVVWGCPIIPQYIYVNFNLFSVGSVMSNE
jgi:hypothetical protein